MISQFLSKGITSSIFYLATQRTKMNDTIEKTCLSSQLTHTKRTQIDAVGKSTASINVKLFFFKG